MFQQSELQNDRIVTAAGYTKCKGKFTAGVIITRRQVPPRSATQMRLVAIESGVSARKMSQAEIIIARNHKHVARSRSENKANEQLSRLVAIR